MHVKFVTAAVVYCFLSILVTLCDLLTARRFYFDQFTLLNGCQALISLLVASVLNCRALCNIRKDFTFHAWNVLPLSVASTVHLVLDGGAHHGWPVAGYHILNRSLPILVLAILVCTRTDSSRKTYSLANLLQALAIAGGSLCATESEFFVVYLPRVTLGYFYSFVVLVSRGVALVLLARHLHQRSPAISLLSSFCLYEFNRLVTCIALDVATGGKEIGTMTEWFDLNCSTVCVMLLVGRFFVAFIGQLLLWWMVLRVGAFPVAIVLVVEPVIEFLLRYWFGLAIMSDLNVLGITLCCVTLGTMACSQIRQRF